MNINDAINILPEALSAIAGVFGGGFLMNRYSKRKANLENENIVINQLTSRLEQQQAHNDKLEERCDKLYNDVMMHRDEKIKLRDEITELKLQLQNERLYRCERHCSRRQPKSESEILNQDDEN